MSVTNAFNAAVSGLHSQATALSNISNNIANSSTVGYKSVETQFEALVLDNSSNPNLADSLSGVRTTTRSNITTAGDLETTGSSTDVAINGSGFLVVNTKPNSANGNYLATRAGSFRPDSSGNLVNAAGYYLQGVPLDAQGNPVAGNTGSALDSLSTVNLSSVAAATTPTTNITFAANLPLTETAYSPTTPTPPTTTVNYYDALGRTNTLKVTFTPVQAAAGNPQTNQWTMDVFDSSLNTTIETNTLTFNDLGTSSAGSLQSVTIPGSPTTTDPNYDPGTGVLTVSVASGQKIAIKIGTPGSSNGMTQYDASYVVTNLQKDGTGFGLLQNVNITTDGKVMANFSNGSSRAIYQIKLATTPNPTGMIPVNGDAYAFNAASGAPTLNNPGIGSAGTTQGGSLEGSNVDVTSELTNLIETQRAYSSAATVIQTGSQMLDVANHLSQG